MQQLGGQEVLAEDGLAELGGDQPEDRPVVGTHAGDVHLSGPHLVPDVPGGGLEPFQHLGVEDVVDDEIPAAGELLFLFLDTHWNPSQGLRFV